MRLVRHGDFIAVEPDTDSDARILDAAILGGAITLQPAPASQLATHSPAGSPNHSSDAQA
ncbi:hypothetical protein DSM104635_03841 [Terricaulis silvestris]|uniref:Uncharacterized protein n=1 Tax=Terricaulis silvestris TaxID=2686094 RepID=A0A6I6MU46_9CAUL|nr:hypothetical protein DSM104635_03841 [Terricaulis silvestris]